MKAIEPTAWKPHPEKPGYVVPERQRAVAEVFAELKQRLELTGYLPDEYLLLDHRWQNGELWPENGDIFSSVDYGSSEGIYLDIYIKYYDEKSGNNVTLSFATGKTLGESHYDMDRMNLIASAVTQAFHSDGVHARYIAVSDGTEQENSAVVHLNAGELKLLADALLDRRMSDSQDRAGADKLLRRLTGSVTEYSKERGIEQVGLAGAITAIQDGELGAFAEALPTVKPEDAGALLNPNSAYTL